MNSMSQPPKVSTSPQVLEAEPEKKDGKEPQLVSLIDGDLIVTIIAFEIHWHHYIRKEGYKTEFFFVLSEVEDLIKKWQSMEKIPIDDIRKLHRARKIFNSVVHGDYGP